MSTYSELIADVLDEINEEDKTADISSESLKNHILQACQKIANSIPIEDQTDLRVLFGVDTYNFANSTVPITATGTINALNNTVTGVVASGTGTISTSQGTVTGLGTAFLTELKVGRMIIVGTEAKTVNTITSNTSCTIDGQFNVDLVSSAFTYSTTMFTKEVNVGSTIISNSISKVIATITDAYNMTVTLPYAVSQSSQAFTVDTKVTEIPTKFYQITRCARLEGIMWRNVRVTPHDKLVKQKVMDWGQPIYSNLNQPYMVAQWQESGTRYLEFYPPVQTDKQVTLFGLLQINPRDYSTVALTDQIPLSQEYEPAIMEWVKYRVYRKLKDAKLATDSFTLFENYVNKLITNLPNTREVTVDYQ